MIRDRVPRTSTFGDPEQAGGESCIRPARDEDAPALARILPLVFRPGSKEAQEYSSVEAMRWMILGFGTGAARQAWFSLLVAERAGRVVGAVTFRHGMHSNQPFMAPVYTDIAILDTLAVAPDARHGGVGRALVRRAEADMRTAGARVMMLNCPLEAAGFYGRCAYIVEGSETCCVTAFPRQGRKVFTSSRSSADGEDARVAWRSLMGARPSSAPYTHPAKGEPAVAVRGVIPGDRRRFPGWPEVPGMKLGQPSLLGVRDG